MAISSVKYFHSLVIGDQILLVHGQSASTTFPTPDSNPVWVKVVALRAVSDNQIGVLVQAPNGDTAEEVIFYNNDLVELN